MLKAVIFDMDGVIVDSEAIHSQAYEAVFNEYGITPAKNAHGTVHISGATTKETWDILKKSYDLQEDTAVLTAKKQQAMLQTLQGEVRPLPGAVELIQDLAAHGIKIGLGTAGQRKRVDIVLQKLGVDTYFNTIVTGDDVRHGKPAPDIYQKAAAQLGADPSECVVLEDAEGGVRAAAAAGIKAVAIPNKYTERMDFSAAAKIVGSLEELSYQKLCELF